MTTLNNVSARANAANSTGSGAMLHLLIAVAAILIGAILVSAARPATRNEAPRTEGRILAPIDAHGTVEHGKQVAPRAVSARDGVKPGKSLPSFAHVAR